jgi:hypothetical protein
MEYGLRSRVISGLLLLFRGEQQLERVSTGTKPKTGELGFLVN